MKKRAIIVDFDGTLCDAKGRRHYIEGDKPNFDKFYEAAAFCLPNDWCVRIIIQFANLYEIIIVTGQPFKFQKNIKDWLQKHEIHSDQIFNRKDGDFRKDSIVKKEIYEDHIKHHYDIIFCLDDRKQVTDMWRAEGLTVLQCDEGNF